MGYRSDVFIAIDSEVYFAHKMGIGGHLPSMIEEADSITFVERDDGSYHLITYSDIKWYESYSDIADVTTLLVKLVGSEQAAYVVIGEDYNDVIEYGDLAHYDMEIIRESPTIYHPNL